MRLPDSFTLLARQQALANRGVNVTYKQETQTINRGTGAVSNTATDTAVVALISGEERKEGSINRTFRVLTSTLPSGAPSLKDSVAFGSYTYRIYGWKTSQHGDVIDLMGSRG